MNTHLTPYFERLLCAIDDEIERLKKLREDIEKAGRFDGA